MMKKNLLRTLSTLLAIVMLVSVLAGCAGKSAEPVQPTTEANTASTEAGSNENAPTGKQLGGKVVAALSGNPTEFFTPYKQGTMTNYAWAVYEPLARDKADSTFAPCLAESWTVDEAENSLTVKIREGVSFSNGDTLDADDVVFSLSCREEYGTYGLIGSPVSIEKLDTYTVKITWAEFSLNFESWILTQFIYSKETFEEKGLDWMLNNMVGTGPYVVDDYIPDVHLLFVRNENYWGDEVPGPDSIEWLVISDATSRIAAFLNGELAEMTNISDPTMIAQLTAAGYTPYDPVVVQSNQYLAIPITTDENDPLSNEAVRKAIQKGVDWENLIKTTNGEGAYHIDAIGMNKMPYYRDDLNKVVLDVEGAKKDLADAGYPNGFSTTIYCFKGTASQATVLQNALSKLGITAEVETLDYTVFNGEYITGKSGCNGILINVWTFYMSNQTDRFSKFLSPVGALKGVTTFTPEQESLWEKVPVSRTMDEQNANLYAFVDCYVNDSALVWPMGNTSAYHFYQPWYHFEDEGYSMSCGRDTMYMWVEKH